jgi:hypothetical protein
VVILNIRNEEIPTESINLCVLKKEVQTNDESKRFKLVNFDSTNNKYDGCSSYPGLLNNSMPYLRISSPFECTLTSLVNNIQARYPSLVLIGSDGPFVNI